MSETQTETQTETKQQEHKLMCPCCRQMTLPETPDNINPELIDQYMACVLAGVPFQHEYPLYNGRILITVATQTSEQKAMASRLVTLLDNCQSQLLVNKDDMRGLLRIMPGVVEIKINPGRQDMQIFHPSAALGELRDSLESHMQEQTNDQDMLAAAFKKTLGPMCMSGVHPHIVMAVVNAHANVSAILLNVGFDRNFWKGIELA